MQPDFRLGDWVVQPGQCRLSRAGRTIHVRAKVMDLLTYLAAHPGEVLSKDRLLDEVWGSQAVSESALTRTVTELRQALGDSADAPELLETIPKRGYRLIGSVAPVEGTPGLVALVPRPRTRSRLKLAAALGAAVLLIGVASWAWFRGDVPPATVRLAVLPFDYIGGDRERQYLADGLAEDTTVSLGMIDPARLIVIGRTSTLRYRNTTKSITEIGRELAADYLVESAVRNEGSRLRLTSKLIRVKDQALVWSGSYERDMTSVLGLQLEVSDAIAQQIRFRISTKTRAAIERRHTRNADAYDLYLRGRTLWNQRKPLTTVRAIEYYKRAIALDPGYALAWSGLADAYAASPINGDAEPSVMRPLARHAAGEAVRAEPALAEVQVSQGILNFWLEWNWPATERAAREAIALNSAHPFGHLVLGNVLSHTGRHREAQEEIRRARELDPLDPMLHAISAQFAYNARDYSSAAGHAHQALIADPEFWIGHAQLGQALGQMGDVDPALESLVKAERFSGGNSKSVSTRGYVLGKAGRTSEARVALEALTTRARERYVPMYAIATVHAGLGNRDALFASLEAAYAAHDVHLVFLPVDPQWDPYRTDPRFTALLERCGFMRQRD
jgi:DNA-binding winged helix-turn-helix (wHTH) protein/TolB-like protein/tetratricopeptide (TPR) repeat protein